MWQTLEALREREILADVDVELARFLAAEDAEADWPVLLGAALASHGPQQGDTCVDLAARAGQPLGDEAETLAHAPGLVSWREALAASSVVGEPGDFQPLILEGDRLYLQRYWAYEAAIAADLRQRGAAQVEGVDTEALRASLDRLFPASEDGGPDWQKVAAAVAVLRRLTLITGGPGTGKTTTVTRLLAALLDQPHTQPPRIALAAPTGKAAARMQEAVHQAKAALPLEAEHQSAIPEQARTLHRLLGARRHSNQFRHNRDNPLPFDVVVVDEASMVDVALFAKLLDAIPAHARLILVGDRHQLAPVEAGSVLGEITTANTGFTPAFADRLGEIGGAGLPTSSTATHPLTDNLVELQRTHRFGEEGGLGPLVRATQAGEAEQALALLSGAEHPEIDWRALPESRGDWERLVGELAGRFAPLLDAAATADPGKAFAAYRHFGVLDALRQGPQGTEALNRQMESALRRQGRIPAPGSWYPGKPVLVTRNDYRLGLFNGDIGIALPEGDGVRVYFETADGQYRALAPSRLPAHELAYALTVHKSQGSELGWVALLVPELHAGLNSRELLYTGLSRAQRGLTVHGTSDVLRKALTTPLQRASGLAAKLDADSSEV